MAANGRQRVRVAGRELTLSNLDKVLYAAADFTKAGVIDYYARVADAMLPHLTGRPITLKRYPDGVAAEAFYEKNCPDHRPDWLATATVPSKRRGRPIRFCRLEEPASLVWAANLAALELHPYLHEAAAPGVPRMVVSDLDPGPGVRLTDLAGLALALRSLLEGLGLRAWVKHSGGKGLHLAVPLNDPAASYEQAKPFARAVAGLMERRRPEAVTANMSKAQRAGRVLIDWSQNTRSKTTAGVYSLRATAVPRVSLPLAWHEIEALAAGQPEPDLGPAAALDRLERVGDLWQAVLTARQGLPEVAG